MCSMSVGRWFCWHIVMISNWKRLAAVPVIFCVSFLLVAVVVYESTTDNNDATSQIRLTDEEVKSLVRHLRSIPTEDGPEASKARSLFVSARYPVVIRKHTLPNYVLNADRLRSVANPNGDLFRSRYVDGIKVFVHFPRSSGTSIINCLKWMTNGTSSFLAPLASEDYRLVWDSFDSLSQRYRNRFDFHAGGHSFGICDAIYQRPCSYFTVFRDPLRQAVSSYYHCRESLADPQCNVINANEVSLRDWIVLQGGSLFAKFLYDSDVCRRNLSNYLETNNDTRKVINLEMVSCWYKHKLWVNTFPEEEKRILLDYILENLDRFFAVLGIFEDMERTFKVLEYVYGLPFSECSHFIAESTSKRGVTVNSAGFDVLHSDQKEVERLWIDPEVQNALEYDYKIYERAKDIFSQQNQRLFNWLKR